MVAATTATREMAGETVQRSDLDLDLGLHLRARDGGAKRRAGRMRGAVERVGGATGEVERAEATRVTLRLEGATAQCELEEGNRHRRRSRLRQP